MNIIEAEIFDLYYPLIYHNSLYICLLCSSFSAAKEKA
jgi:hypothetical protein